VLALHGAGGNGRFMERFSGLTPVANRWGYVAVYPDAAGKFWQIVQGHDDVAFVSALLDSVEESVCVDATRVYATGVSNGGGMVARLGCELSGRLAAIAPVAGGPYAKLPPCHPDRPVAVLEIHGTNDAAVPYSQVPPFLHMWQDLDGCEARIVYTHVALRALGVNRPFCPAGESVDHIEMLGGPHAWPGTPEPGPGHGSPVSAALRVMRFFAGRRVAEQ
jgi:polyhydroxybutyrate depolymerase